MQVSFGSWLADVVRDYSWSLRFRGWSGCYNHIHLPSPSIYWRMCEALGMFHSQNYKCYFESLLNILSYSFYNVFVMWFTEVTTFFLLCFFFFNGRCLNSSRDYPRRWQTFSRKWSGTREVIWTWFLALCGNINHVEHIIYSIFDFLRVSTTWRIVFWGV